MRVFKIILIAIAIQLTPTSCARTLSVFKEGKRVKGMPFYAHKGVVEQKTTYLFKWKEITIEEQEVGSKEKIPVATAQTKDNKGIKDVEATINSMDSESTREDVKALITKVYALHSNELLESVNIESKNMVENKWVVKTIVDYSEKYYLNSKLPWLGSSTINQKLAPNGSLTEVTGTTDSQIDDVAGTIVSLATPLSTIKVAEIQAEAASIPLATDQAKSYLQTWSKLDYSETQLSYLFSKVQDKKFKYSLKVEEKGYLYTFTKNHEIGNDGPCDTYTPLEFDIKRGNFIREKWPAVKSEPNETDDSEIKISGKIQLPDDEEDGNK